MKPLVSILIPAHNAEKWIQETIRSAIAQTWPRKEIIVVNDGSRDHTAEVARQFASKEVMVVSTENQGASAARNHAQQLSQGEYLQWLDADDLLAPDKIQRQLDALPGEHGRRILLHSPYACFYYRTRRAQFPSINGLRDLSPVEALLAQMGQHSNMQTATWLTSRELAEAAGSWDTRLISDDDAEYFARVIMASQCIRFVPEAKVFYRIAASNRRSEISGSDKKKEALIFSMKLRIQYVRSLEDSERVRKACLEYLQRPFGYFYPERPDLVAELQALAAELGGHLEIPGLRWKYAWMEPVFGRTAASWAQEALPGLKASCIVCWDKMMYGLENRKRLSEA